MSDSSSFASIFELANITAPASGVTHAAKWLVSITGGGTATINMQSQMEFLGNFIGQAMTVDNTANSVAVTVTEQFYGWERIIQPGVSQTFQYPAVPQQIFTFTTSGSAAITVSIYDWPAFPDSSSINSSSAPAANVNVVNSPTVEIGAGAADIGTIHVAGTVPVSFAGGVTLAPGGTVTVLEGTTPWVVSGTVALSGTSAIGGTVTLAAGVANVGTVEIGAGTATIGTVAVSGTVPVSGSVTVLGTVPVSGTVGVTQSTSPWAVAGNVASGVAVAGNPVLDGGRAANAEPASVANGQAVAWMLDLLGRGIVFPYANKENIIGGSTTSTGTVAVTLIASPGASLFNYVTSLQLSNSGTAATVVTLNDTNTSQFIVPAGGGSNVEFPLPIHPASATALTFTPSVATTTLVVNAQGFKGS